MTALGDVGGRAKRMESEAKMLRGKLGVEMDHCVVVIDESLFRFAQDSYGEWATTFELRRAVGRNIQGNLIYASILKKSTGKLGAA
jgi:hypothetical protein